MELGLSLGDSSTSSKPYGFLKKKSPVGQSNNNNSSNLNNNGGGGLGFCMALGIGSNTNVVQQENTDKPEKSLENEQKHVSDERHNRDGKDDGDGDDDDDDDEASVETPVQLDLLPLVPVPRQTPWSSDDGSSDNGSSGNMGLPAARRFDVNRLPAAGEKVSSERSVGSSPFQMDFSIYRSSGNVGGRNKRDLEVALIGNDVVEADRAGSRASDEDDNGSNTRKKLRLSKEQSAFLEESFKEHNTLNPKQKLGLAKQLNLRPRQVEVWFQNRRARTKLKQTEVDCEYLKRCCETLTEENRRLHKELQELRALKTSNPFYMQLPATTLTMCPSCERVATTTTVPPAAAATATTTTIVPTPSTTPNAKTNITDSTPPKATTTPFPLSRPRFFPFSPTPSHPHQSAAS